MDVLNGLVGVFDQKWVQAFTTISVVYLLFYAFIKGVRDVFDKTPATDDNGFERFVTVLGKLADLFAKGKRPDA